MRKYENGKERNRDKKCGLERDRERERGERRGGQKREMLVPEKGVINV